MQNNNPTWKNGWERKFVLNEKKFGKIADFLEVPFSPTDWSITNCWFQECILHSEFDEKQWVLILCNAIFYQEQYVHQTHLATLNSKYLFLSVHLFSCYLYFSSQNLENRRTIRGDISKIFPTYDYLMKFDTFRDSRLNPHDYFYSSHNFGNKPGSEIKSCLRNSG